jgi:hypothetical protein
MLSQSSYGHMRDRSHPGRLRHIVSPLADGGRVSNNITHFYVERDDGARSAAVILCYPSGLHPVGGWSNLPSWPALEELSQSFMGNELLETKFWVIMDFLIDRPKIVVDAVDVVADVFEIPRLCRLLRPSIVVPNEHEAVLLCLDTAMHLSGGLWLVTQKDRKPISSFSEIIVRFPQTWWQVAMNTHPLAQEISSVVDREAVFRVHRQLIT